MIFNQFSENDLEAKAIELLDELDFNGYTFNPHRVIKAVNIFYSLGQEKSCQIFHNYFELNSDKCFIDWIIAPVVQNLFIYNGKPNKDLLYRLIQDTSIKIPERHFLQFTFNTYKDIPFMLKTGGGFISGELPSWPSVEKQPYLYYFRESPMIPDDNPLICVDELLAMKDADKVISSRPWLPNLLKLQALNTVSNVYPISEQDQNVFLSSNNNEEAWIKHKQAFAALNIKWNPLTNEYDLGKPD